MRSEAATKADVAALQTTMATLLLEIRAIRADQARHRRGATETDRDRALALALSVAFKEEAFTATDVTARADTDAALRGMQAMAHITTTRQLGCWLRHVQGQDLGGLSVLWLGAGRDGAVWRVLRV